MTSQAVRSEIRVEMFAFSQPLASKRFHEMDEAVDWTCGVAAKLRLAFEAEIYRQLDKTIEVILTVTILAHDYSHACKVWSGTPSTAELMVPAAAKKFLETALPVELEAAQTAGSAADRRTQRKTWALVLAGAALCAAIFGVLRALPPVFDTEVQSARVLTAPPKILEGAWATSIEACEQTKVIFSRGRMDVVSNAASLSYNSTYDRLEGNSVRVSIQVGAARISKILRIDAAGTSLQIQRIELTDGVPRALAALAVGTRLVRCR